MERLLDLIRARRLDRVGAAYAVTAWLLVQVASIALPAFAAPPWIMQWLIITAIIGFPAALAIAWLLVAPEGEAHAGIRMSRRGWVLSGVVAVILAASLVELAIFWSKPAVKTAESAAAPAPAEASIAVLPFANMSGDAGQKYFSDGIADELIGELSRIPSLRVAARTSSFAFADRKADVKTIARTLGVRTILEGSVRTVGNRVRITAELVNASDGFHVWSETYDGELTDILGLQDRIAGAIAKALTHRLVPTARTRDIDPEAYRKYLEGRFYLAQRTEDSIKRASELFKAAIALDPAYAEAYANLGAAYLIGAFNFQHTELVPAADEALKKALSLQYDNVQALVLDSVLATLKHEWRRALSDQRRLQTLKVGSAEALHGRAVFYGSLSLNAEMAALERAAVLRDPLSFISHYNLATSMYGLGRYKEGVADVREALEIVPGHPGAEGVQCDLLVGSGDLAAARRIAAKVEAGLEPKDGVQPFSYCVWNVRFASGDKTGALRMLDAAAKAFPKSIDNRSVLGQAYWRAGMTDEAIGWFEKALAAGEPQVFQVIGLERLDEKLKNNPRWQELMQTPSFREWTAVREQARKEFSGTI